jgi:hypothetical protein
MYRLTYRRVIILALALAALLLAVPPRPAAAIYSGVWTGQTTQSERINLVFEGRTLQQITVRVLVRGDDPDYCNGQAFFIANNYPVGLVYVEGNSFELFWEQDGMQLTMSGRFEAGGRLSGELRLTTTDATAAAPLCLGTGEASWFASRTSRSVPTPRPFPTFPPALPPSGGPPASEPTPTPSP